MSLKCYFQFDSGRFCKKSAMNGSRFCNNHQPRGAAIEGQYDPHGWPQLHPHVRLATPNDLFDLVRESLLGTRTGSVTPSQAFAISSLATVWLRVYDTMVQHQRLRALNRQILPSLVDADSSATAEREAALDDDADRRAAEDPAPLVAHDPWAAGRMAGPVPSNGQPAGLGPVPVPSRIESAPPVYPEAVADSRRAPSNSPAPSTGQPVSRMVGPVYPEAVADSRRVPSRSEPAATALSASAAPSEISNLRSSIPGSTPLLSDPAGPARLGPVPVPSPSPAPGSIASKPNGRGHD